MIYKLEDIQPVQEEYEYRDIELDKAIQEDRLIEYVLEETFEHRLTLEEQFIFKQEILNEDLDKNGISGIMGISQDQLEKLTSVDSITKMIDKLNEKEREEEDKLAKAEVNKKGFIHKVIYYIKKAIKWLKRKLLRIKDNTMDLIRRTPSGFHAAARGAKEIIERGTAGNDFSSFINRITTNS